MKSVLFFVAAALLWCSCQTPEAREKERREKEERDMLAAAVSRGMVYCGLSSEVSDEITKQWAYLAVHEPDKSLDYAKKIRDIVLGGRAPTEREWRVSNLGLETPTVVADTLSVEEKQSRLAAAKKSLRIEKDEMKEVTFYYAPNAPKYVDRNAFFVYMGQDKDRAWLRLKIQYAADDWLFIQKYIVKADSSLFNIIPTTSLSQDNGGGMIWETFDESVTDTDYKMLRQISEAKSVKLRCEGKQYYRDRMLSDGEKKGIKQVLDLYDLLKMN